MATKVVWVGKRWCVVGDGVVEGDGIHSPIGNYTLI